MLTGPLTEYRAKLAAGELKPDPAQALAAEKLQSLCRSLESHKLRPELGGWKARFGFGSKKDQPRGLYIHGKVGRGKSLLMNMFFRAAPVKRKRRVHFHEFMQQVHERLNERRKAGGGGDPISEVARLFAQEAWLLCFDEFQVQDIADAMILGRLFETLFQEGVVVVATSNRFPADLYKDGLQRERFLPFIEMIQKRLDILALAGGKDYRLSRLAHMNVYLTPHDHKAGRSLGQYFTKLTNGAPAFPDSFTIKGRRITLPLAADGVALADFEDLCGAALGPSDYLEVARRYHTLILCQIPQMTPGNRDRAKRFMTLIDALYENGTNLICSAAAPAGELYPSGHGAFEFKRTASRLIEMQSVEYIKARGAAQ